MSEFGQIYAYQSDPAEEEDAPTVAWIDQTLQAAENEGRLGALGAQVDNVYFTDLDTLGGLVEQTQSAEQPEVVPSAPLTRDEIREKIFAKLRRPDGTPYAAGYVEGPAARKAEYEGEDQRVGWRSRSNPDGTSIVTQYDDRDSIQDRASGHDAQGRVVDADGDPIDGRWGWVIDDETGALLLFDAARAVVTTPEGEQRVITPGQVRAEMAAGNRIAATHHTTPVAGMPVTGAGMISLNAGFITEITDESGHYRPDGPQQHAALEELMRQGYSLEQAQVRLTGREGGGRPTDKASWLDEAGDGNADFPTGDVSLRPEQFMQTGGDEYQIRNKMALNAQINRLGDREGTVTLESQGQGPDDSGNANALRDGVQPGNYGNYGDNYQNADAQPGNYGNYGDNYQNADAQPGNYGNYGDNYQNADAPDDNYQNLDDGQNAPDDNYQNVDDPNDNYQNLDEETPEQVQARFADEAHTYLTTAGRSAFAEFFAALPPAQQDLLVADPRIGTSWRAEPQAAPQGWQPAEEHHAAAAQVNAGSVDALDDRGSAPFTVAGFSVLIGDGHDEQHRAFADAAADAVTGTVTVRKAGLGRGAGSLTFTGVPPAKQEIVRSAVARFSRKDVRF